MAGPSPRGVSPQGPPPRLSLTAAGPGRRAVLTQGVGCPHSLATQLLLRVTGSASSPGSGGPWGPVSLAGGTQGEGVLSRGQSGRTDGAGGSRKVPSTGGGVGSQTQRRETRATKPKENQLPRGKPAVGVLRGGPCGQGAEMSLEPPRTMERLDRRLQVMANSGGGRSADRPLDHRSGPGPDHRETP